MSSLAEKMVPQSLDEVLGQENTKKAIRSWIKADDFPRCQLFTGPVGTGKSSLATLIARACQGPEGWEGSDIRQINAGSVGKVDDMRDLAEQSISRPLIGRYRVFILEEAHRATDAAQDAILVPMETNTTTVWILTSSEPSKLLPAVRSRCSAATFDIKPLTKLQMVELTERALVVANPRGDWESDKAAEWLYEKDVRQPREILGVLDLWFSGVPLEECLQSKIHEPLYRDVSSAVLSGNWTKASGLLAQIKTADSRGLVAITSAFLRQELLKNGVGARADALATCLVGLDSTGFADGVAYGAVTGLLYKTCKAIQNSVQGSAR